MVVALYLVCFVVCVVDAYSQILELDLYRPLHFETSILTSLSHAAWHYCIKWVAASSGADALELCSEAFRGLHDEDTDRRMLQLLQGYWVETSSSLINLDGTGY